MRIIQPLCEIIATGRDVRTLVRRMRGDLRGLDVPVQHEQLLIFRHSYFFST